MQQTSEEITTKFFNFESRTTY